MRASESSKSKQTAEIGRMLKHLTLTIAPLQSDLDFSTDHWEKDKSNQFWRRNVIRCLFALTEATIWNMKNVSPKIAAVTGLVLTNDEVAFIKEERTTMKNGKAEVRRKFPSFRDNVKETFKLFAKVHCVSFTFSADANFDALCATYELRSRLMHPKRPFDPAVSDSDIRVAEKGMRWLIKEWGDLMASCGIAAGAMVRKVQS